MIMTRKIKLVRIQWFKKRLARIESLRNKLVDEISLQKTISLLFFYHYLFN